MSWCTGASTALHHLEILVWFVYVVPGIVNYFKAPVCSKKDENENQRGCFLVGYARV